MHSTRIQAMRSRTQRSPSLCENHNGAAPRPPPRRSFSSLNLNPPTGPHSQHGQPKSTPPSGNTATKSSSTSKNTGSVKQDVRILGVPAAVFQFVLIVVISVIASVIIVYTPDNRTPQAEEAFKLKDPIPKRAAQTESGWRQVVEKPNAHYFSNVCNIPKIAISKLTEEDFEKDYEYKNPLIITFDKGAAEWIRRNSWNRDSLVKQYGAHKVKVASSDVQAQVLGVDGRGSGQKSFIEMTFSDFLVQHMDMEENSENLGVMEKEMAPETAKIEGLQLPTVLGDEAVYERAVLQVGGSESGVGFHRSTDSWVGVVHGETTVAIYPAHTSHTGHVMPGVGTGDHGILSWFRHIYPTLPGISKPLMCRVKEGELIYVPEGSYHGSINLADTVALRWRRKHPSTSSMELVYQAHHLRRTDGEAMNGDEDVTGILTERLHALSQVAHAQPDNVDGWLDLSEVQIRLGHVQDGFRSAEKAVRSDTSTTRGHFILASLLAKAGRGKEAEQRYQAAMRSNPDNWKVCLEYGDFLEKYKRYKEAGTMLEKAVALHPSNSALWRRLLTLLQKSGASSNKIRFVNAHMTKRGLT